MRRERGRRRPRRRADPRCLALGATAASMPTAHALHRNGLPSLDIPVSTNERLRLRLLNAARDRLLTLRIDRHRRHRDGDRRPAGRAVSARATAGSRFRPATASISSSTRRWRRTASAPIFVGLDDREAPLARLVYGSARLRARTAPRRGKAAAGKSAAAAHELRGRVKLDIALDDPRHRPAPGSFGRPLFTARRPQSVMIGFKNTTEPAQVVHLHGHSCAPARRARRRLEAVLARHHSGAAAAHDARRLRGRQSRQVAD